MEFSDSVNVLFLCKNIDFEFPEELQFDSFSIVQQTLLSKIVSKWVTIETPSKYILDPSTSFEIPKSNSENYTSFDDWPKVWWYTPPNWFDTPQIVDPTTEISDNLLRFNVMIS